MKNVFICSPFRNEDYLTQIENKDFAKECCRFAALNGVAPFAPHVFCTEFLQEAIDREREIGINIGLSFLDACDEMWVFADFNEDISEGMKTEIKHFSEKFPDKKIRYFTRTFVERDKNLSKES